MAQLPCIGLSWPLTKPPFGGCTIYFPGGIIQPGSFFDQKHILWITESLSRQGPDAGGAVSLRGVREVGKMAGQNPAGSI